VKVLPKFYMIFLYFSWFDNKKSAKVPLGKTFGGLNFIKPLFIYLCEFNKKPDIILISSLVTTSAIAFFD
jgi:hypothetical protein